MRSGRGGRGGGSHILAHHGGRAGGLIGMGCVCGQDSDGMRWAAWVYGICSTQSLVNAVPSFSSTLDIEYKGV